MGIRVKPKTEEVLCYIVIRCNEAVLHYLDINYDNILMQYCTYLYNIKFNATFSLQVKMSLHVNSFSRSNHCDLVPAYKADSHVHTVFGSLHVS